MYRDEFGHTKEDYRRQGQIQDGIFLAVIGLVFFGYFKLLRFAFRGVTQFALVVALHILVAFLFVAPRSHTTAPGTVVGEISHPGENRAGKLVEGDIQAREDRDALKRAAEDEARIEKERAEIAERKAKAEADAETARQNAEEQAALQREQEAAAKREAELDARRRQIEADAETKRKESEQRVSDANDEREYQRAVRESASKCSIAINATIYPGATPWRPLWQSCVAQDVLRRYRGQNKDIMMRHFVRCEGNELNCLYMGQPEDLGP